ncbi:hypothetical protein [Persicirhabdus sediminis]|uniref:hypothetical protein n=1 Tax=Persicirhabdus sediminis TaxID=454144 RepID=UPI001F3C8A5B|nr:hypothetical protein [Persicirhabdus sediminis]
MPSYVLLILLAFSPARAEEQQKDISSWSHLLLQQGEKDYLEPPGRYFEGAADPDADVLLSKIALYLFPKEPRGHNAHIVDELVDRHAEDELLTTIVVYVAGQPEKAEVFYAGSAASYLNKNESFLSLESSRDKALQSLDPAEQLTAFMDQLVIRLFWVEEQLKKRLPDEMLVVASEPEPVELKSSREVAGKFQLTVQMAFYLQMAAYALVALLLFAFLLYYSSRLYLRYRRYSFNFPEVQTRLQAPGGASIGAIVEYSNDEQSSTEQDGRLPKTF